MKTVLAHGCFDVLHHGHLRYFEAAKRHGDRLVVSVTADRHVNKGPGRPHFSQEIRKQMLEALACVDEVVISDEPTAVGVIRKLKPAVYVKGSDYRDLAADPTGGIQLEKEAVEAHGGKLVFTDEQTFSSSELINRYLASYTDEQRATIDAVKAAGGMPLIRDCLTQIEKLTVRIAGEFITDRYVFCEPMGISNKSATLAARHLIQESHIGGTGAVHRHISEFVRPENIRLFDSHEFNNTKTRYLTPTRQQLFEISDLNTDAWNGMSLMSFHDWLCQNKPDLTMLCDFGHGFFSSLALEAIENLEDFTALNVQTNSANFGFNLFTKHRWFNYLTLDLREARLAVQDNLSATPKLLNKVMKALPKCCEQIAMTLGPDGSSFDDGENSIKVPAFTDKVIDATGAGDAFFALTSLFVKVGAPPAIIPFVGNVFAGLKTKIPGNQRAVTKAEFIKAVEAILK